MISEIMLLVTVFPLSTQNSHLQRRETKNCVTYQGVNFKTPHVGDATPTARVGQRAVYEVKLVRRAQDLEKSTKIKTQRKKL
jgi:excinuclease UvrABC nuclease subunit